MVSSRDLFPWGDAWWGVGGVIPGLERVSIAGCPETGLLAGSAISWCLGTGVLGGTPAMPRTAEGGSLHLNCEKDSCTPAFLLGNWSLGA